MIRDFMAFEAPPELLARMELDRMPANRNGYRLDISRAEIREALDRWKRQEKIPVSDPLSDRQRHEFELWYMTEKMAKK